MITRKRVTASLMMIALAMATGSASAIAGKGRMTSQERLNVSGCGSDRDVNRVLLDLRNNRKWSARTAAGNLSGSYKQRAAGRKIIAEMDSRSRGLFTKSMERWAKQICGTRVDVNTIKSIDIDLKLNKKRTKINGRVRAKGRGTSSQGSGSGTFTGVMKGSFSE